VLPLIQDNIELNGLAAAPGGGRHCGGSAVAEELEWGKEGYLERVAALAAAPIDLVLAADVTYGGSVGSGRGIDWGGWGAVLCV